MEKKTKKKFQWNVWIWDFNQDQLEKYDVVPAFMRSIRSLKKSEYPKDIKCLDEFLRSEARYYFMAKCEYEMILHSWPALKNDEKVDVYDQLMLNWDLFVQAFWSNMPKRKAK